MTGTTTYEKAGTLPSAVTTSSFYLKKWAKNRRRKKSSDFKMLMSPWKWAAATNRWNKKSSRATGTVLHQHQRFNWLRHPSRLSDCSIDPRLCPTLIFQRFHWYSLGSWSDFFKDTWLWATCGPRVLSFDENVLKTIHAVSFSRKKDILISKYCTWSSSTFNIVYTVYITKGIISVWQRWRKSSRKKLKISRRWANSNRAGRHWLRRFRHHRIPPTTKLLKPVTPSSTSKESKLYGFIDESKKSNNQLITATVHLLLHTNHSQLFHSTLHFFLLIFLSLYW